MKKYKLNGIKYELLDNLNEPADAFALNGKLCYEKPSKGKHVGYVIMDEGSCIECYSAFNPLVVILPIVASTTVAAALIAYILLNQEQDIAIGETMLRTSMDKNVIVFNGVMAYEDGAVDIRFVNGEQDTKIIITGNGVTPTEITVPAGESLYSMPLSISTEEDVIEATITFSTATSTSEFPVIIEILSNMQGVQGVTGFFKSEVLMND